MDQRAQVLIQAENAKARGMAYVPADAYKGAAVRLADEGLLDRPPTGNYWINSDGERELAAIRRERKPQGVR